MSSIIGQGRSTYTVEEVAELFDKHAETIRRWIRSDKLRATKIGRDYSIRRADLREFWRELGGTRPPGDEPAFAAEGNGLFFPDSSGPLPEKVSSIISNGIKSGLSWGEIADELERSGVTAEVVELAEGGSDGNS